MYSLASTSGGLQLFDINNITGTVFVSSSLKGPNMFAQEYRFVKFIDIFYFGQKCVVRLTHKYYKIAINSTSSPKLYSNIEISSFLKPNISCDLVK